MSSSAVSENALTALLCDITHDALLEARYGDFLFAARRDRDDLSATLVGEMPATVLVFCPAEGREGLVLI